MKKLKLLSLLLLFPFMINAQTKSTLEIASFNQIDLDISADVNIKQGDKQKVEVSGPQDLIDLLNKEVKGETWEIKYTKRNVKSSKGLEISITVPHLEEINLNGSGDIKGLSAWHEEEMEISVNGSGNIELEIYVEDLEIDINGSGDITLSGTSEKTEVGINGSGDLRASDLKTAYAEVSVNGSGDTKIYVSKKLDAEVNGSGDVLYIGDPDLKIRKNGSGSIKSSDG